MAPGIPDARDLPTLEHVVRWAHGHGLDVHDAIAMDEFAFDVLIRLSDSVILAFDST